MKRASANKSANRKLVALWIPSGMDEAINSVVESQDTDRSKFIRQAVKRQFEELGIVLTPAKPKENS